MNNNIDEECSDSKSEQSTTITVVDVVKNEIKNNLKEILASANFVDVVRLHFKTHPDEFSKWLKDCDNDFSSMCCKLTNLLNKELEEVEVKNEEYETLENTTKILVAKMNSLTGNGFSQAVTSLCTEIQKNQKKLQNMSQTTIKDLSYSKNNLSALIDRMKNSLMDITPITEPSDNEARKKLVFEKKMTFEQSLFTILFNTRPQTLPISILNLKGWAARLAQRLTHGESKRSNLPTMLIFRSRTDNGEVKGNSGKSSIANSLCDLLNKKGLNVADSYVGLKIPTFNTIDKQMSDKSLIMFDDMNFNNVSWEDLNNFCDGVPIKNKGKYLKEGYIFPFGNIIGTTNYDLPYKNNKRYPVIEFTPNDAPIVSEHPLVKKDAIYTKDDNARIYDFSDAWETLLSYACDNINEWIDEYNKNLVKVASTCSRQRTKLEQMVIASLSDIYIKSKQLLSPQTMLEWMREKYRDEARYKIGSVYDAMKNIGLKPTSKDTNIYRATFTIPDDLEIDQVQDEEDVVKVHAQIFGNGDVKPCEETKSANHMIEVKDGLSEKATDDLERLKNKYKEIFN